METNDYYINEQKEDCIFYIGDEVRLKITSGYYGKTGQIPDTGIIYDTYIRYWDDSVVVYNVKWGNGRNNYDCIDLELVKREPFEQFEDWDDDIDEIKENIFEKGDKVKVKIIRDSVYKDFENMVGIIKGIGYRPNVYFVDFKDIKMKLYIDENVLGLYEDEPFDGFECRGDVVNESKIQKFKVGDRVIVIFNRGYDYSTDEKVDGKEGIIKYYYGYDLYSIEFDENIDGWDCDGHTRCGYGWNVRSKNIRLIDIESFEQFEEWEDIDESISKNKWEYTPPEEYSDELILLVQNAYKNTKKGSLINTKKDTIKSDWLSINIDEYPELDATIFYRCPREYETWVGKKIQGLGHDGTLRAIEIVLTKLKKLLNEKGTWVEASGKVEVILYKLGVPYVDDEELAKNIFPNSNLGFIGDKGKYTRNIESGQVEETIFGIPVLK